MKGNIQVAEVLCKSLQHNALGDTATRSLPVYIPPDYQQADRRFPVCYFLHGFTGSALHWLNVTPFGRNVPERIDALITEGEIPPVIAVFVDGWTALGGSQWINSEAIGKYRDMLVKDIVPFVDKTFRTAANASSRAVLGKSSGGYGAWVMGRHHPDVFEHIAAHSADAGFEFCYLHELPQAAGSLLKAGGVEAWFKEFVQRAQNTKMRGDDHAVINMLCMSAAYASKKGEPLNLELPIDIESGRIKLDVWNRWLVQDPVRFIPKSLSSLRKLRSIFFDCGTKDEFHLRWGARQIAEELKAAHVAFEHQEFDDGHMGINYRFDASLRFLAPRLGVNPSE